MCRWSLDLQRDPKGLDPEGTPSMRSRVALTRGPGEKHVSGAEGWSVAVRWDAYTQASFRSPLYVKKCNSPRLILSS